MTKEEKQILIKDLCARLPYGVIVSYQVGKNTPVNRVLIGKALDELMRGSYVDEWLKCSFKPYLRPISSITREEFINLPAVTGLQYDQLKIEEWGNNCKTLEFYLLEISHYCLIKVFDWLNKHHFDYRGLIPMGLALEASKDMYKTE